LGRKVHPLGFRLGIIKDWQARWYAEGEEYADLLQEDLKIRDLIRKEMGAAGISRIEIERFPKQVNITVWTAKPGLIIGRKGAMPIWWLRTLPLSWSGVFLTAGR